MGKTTKNFLELIKDYKIIIPLIQRDYAQGREKEKNKAENIFRLIINFFNIVDMKKDGLFIYSIS